MDMDAILEKVTGIFAGLENGPASPDTGALIEKATTIAKVLVIAGPVIMLVLGLLYLFAAPKEANHHFGYRCYFGMGSVNAWRFTQRLAGIVFGSLGLILGIVMLLTVASFRQMALDAMVWKAAKCLGWEAGLALLAHVGVTVTAMVIFDRKGNYRRKKK